MQLNVTTDYAVRALVYLAEENRMVTGVEIANKMQIPPTYLLTIMATLKKAGFISVKRGNAGGYMLAKPQSEITLWDIMEVMEGSVQFQCNRANDIFSESDSSGMGQVRSVYRAVQNTIEERLRGVTLEQLATEGGVDLSQDEDQQSDQAESASV
jgi:Rrf2 family nitric oxide-sensitive transcriptional repressor